QGVLHILLEEKNILPSGYDATDYESKGFYESSEIQDFPIRGKKVLLKLRSRCWQVFTIYKNYASQRIYS
ncbi:MAG: hypothetical protein LBV69_08365, partial [Bacteroidales bacterium]|nr:hypothetical protein [Bacteroidales bacterium]